jgi:hypothetical protein
LYIGFLKDYKPDGKGSMVWPNKKQTYKGQFKNGLFDGQGVQRWPDGSTYRGEYRK